MHAHKGIVEAHLTANWVLDVHEQDVYWCGADLGWVTGVVYGVLGPWSNGVTQVGLGGRFDPDRWYQTIQNYKVSIWYTAPTAVRMLMAKGDDLPGKYDLSSLRALYCVGEHHGAAREPENCLVRVDLARGGAPVVVACGHDFYAAPRPSPDGATPALAQRLSAPLLARFPHSPRAEAGALARLVDVAPLVG